MELSKEHSYIASVVATYWFVSIAMVYLNKVLMSNEDVSIPAPLFVTWFQCVVTAGICYLCGELGEKMRQKEQSYSAVATRDNNDPHSNGGNGESSGSAAHHDGKNKNSFWHQFPKAEYRIGQGQRVFPLSLVFVGMITFNNLCLKWVEVSFYNVARSLTIVFNVILSGIMLGSHSSNKTIGCLAIVIFGFLLGSGGEVDFSMKGTVAGILSSLFVSLNSIYTKSVLAAVDNDHWKLTFYNNVNASIMFLPLMLIFEHGPIAAGFGKQFLSLIFWSAMMVAGFFGFSIGIVTVLQIKATSPLTHNISGTAKAAVQSMMAFYIWGNKATFMGVLGIFVVLGGSLFYTFVKMDEGKTTTVTKKQAPQSPSVDDKDIEVNRPLKSGVN